MRLGNPSLRTTEGTTGTTASLWNVSHSRELKAKQTAAGEEGGGRMSATLFRKYAAEHFGWAKTARSDKERKNFEQMACAWLEAALLWEREPAAEGWMILDRRQASACQGGAAE